MNLAKKKELAAKALGVGKNKICFNPEALTDIKEAITKQDIKTLYEEGGITIKPIFGRKKVIKRKRRKGPGKIKMKVKNRKQNYVKITRKLRRYLKALKNNNKVSKEIYYELRRKIKMKAFRDMAHFKEYLEGLEKISKKIPLKKEKKKEKLKETEEKRKSEKQTKTKGRRLK